jgi:pimeloyl-ACP methyl ester carboxylesterase
LNERVAIDMAAASAAIKHSKVLTIHGTADSVIPVEDGRKFAAHINGSSYVEVAGADHNFRAEPVLVQQLVEAVVHFLQSNLPAAAAPS